MTDPQVRPSPGAVPDRGALRTRAGRQALRAAAADTTADPTSVAAVIRHARRAARAGRARLAAELLATARTAVGPQAARAQARLAAVEGLLELDAGGAGVAWAQLSSRCLELATDPADGWTPDLIADAADLVFHRTLHLDSDISPLAVDAAQVVAPFHDHPVIRAAMQRPLRRDHGPPEQPDRAVLVHQGNVNFAAGVLARLGRTRRTDVVDLWQEATDVPRGSHALIADVIADRTRRWDGELDRLVGAPGLLWAEWAQLQALVVSYAVAPSSRLVVRLHAAELFTAAVQFLQWRRVAALVVVSAPMAAAARQILPLPPDVAVHVIPNHVDAARFSVAKTPDARWTIAMVGHNSHVKDPAFALDVLHLVRAQEPRARLLLVGDGLHLDSPAQGPAAAPYVSAYVPRLEAAIADGSVSVTGHTDDVPSVLMGAGFILSTSRRESFHLGLLEGALSGCVPAVRDWPAMAGFGGPAAFLPDRWVGTTPADLADRIVSFMRDPQAWQAERIRCRAEAESAVADPLDDALAPIIGE